MSLCVLYVTMPDVATAKQMAQVLLAEKLIACANILGSSTSLYPWEGNIEEAQEMVVLLKTVAEKKEAVMQRVVQLHPYDIPCVFELGVGAVHPAFAQWMRKETD